MRAWVGRATVVSANADVTPALSGGCERQAAAGPGAWTSSRARARWEALETPASVRQRKGVSRRDSLARPTERGELVDDALICQVMGARLGEPDAAGGFILDGTAHRAPGQRARRPAGTAGLAVTGALLLDVGDEQVVERLSGRRTCPACGRVYHTAFNPPRRDGRCDHDGTPLAQRDDDLPATIGNRPSRLPPPERAAGRPLPRRRVAGGDRRLGHPRAGRRTPGRRAGAPGG